MSSGTCPSYYAEQLLVDCDQLEVGERVEITTPGVRPGSRELRDPDQLGFAVTAHFGSAAVFVSAGHYHHHMAMNTWNSRGTGRRQQTLGLGLVRIEVPTADELGALDERLDHFGVTRRDDGRTLGFADPWANRIEVAVRLAP